MNKKECERVKTCCAWVQRKLGTTFMLHFMQEDMQIDEDGEEEEDIHTCLTIRRSDRDTDDSSCFIVTFYPKNTKSISFNKLKRACFHEMLHAIEWDKTDLWDEAMSHIKNAKIRDALTKRFYSVEESINYKLERALGPYIITKWDKDQV